MKITIHLQHTALGECLNDPNMSANNLEDKHLVKTWVFSLTKKQVKKQIG